MDFRNSTSPGCDTAYEISLLGFYKISQDSSTNNQASTQPTASSSKPLPNPLIVGPDLFLQVIEDTKKLGFNPLIVYGLAFSAMHVNARAFSDQSYKSLADSFNQSLLNIISSTDFATMERVFSSPILYHFGLKPQDLVRFYTGSLFAGLDYHYNLKSNESVAIQLRQNYENYVKLITKVKNSVPASPRVSPEKQLEYQTKLLVMEWITKSFNLYIEDHLANMANKADSGHYTRRILGLKISKSELVNDLSKLLDKLSENQFVRPVVSYLKKSINTLAELGFVGAAAGSNYLINKVIQPYQTYKEHVGNGNVAMKLVVYDLIADYLEDNPVLLGRLNIKQAEELARLSLQSNLPPTFDAFVDQVKADLRGRSAIEMGLPEGTLRTPGMYVGGGLGALLGLALVAIYNLFAGKKNKTSYWAYLIAAVLGAVLGGYGGYSFGRHLEESPLLQT